MEILNEKSSIKSLLVISIALLSTIATVACIYSTSGRVINEFKSIINQTVIINGIGLYENISEMFM